MRTSTVVLKPPSLHGSVWIDCDMIALLVCAFLLAFSTHRHVDAFSSFLSPPALFTGAPAPAPKPQQPTRPPLSVAATESDLKGQVLLISRKIRQCGSNVTGCLDLLDRLPRIYSSSSITDLESTFGRSPSSIHPGNTTKHTLLEAAYLEALGVIRQAQRKQTETTARTQRAQLIQLALQLYEKCPTEATRSQTISICGQHANKDEGYQTAMRLLRNPAAAVDPKQPASIQSVNAALAVCSRLKYWEEALSLLHQNQWQASTLTCNIVLKAMERAKQGAAALDLLERMTAAAAATTTTTKDRLDHLPPPDRSSFHHVMRALTAAATAGGNSNSTVNNQDPSSNVDAAYRLLDTMFSFSLEPNNTTLDLLVSAFGRVGDWDMAGLVEEFRHQSWRIGGEKRRVPPDPVLHRASLKHYRQQQQQGNISSATMNLNLHWERNQHGIHKVGKGKVAHWDFATYEKDGIALTVALQPHRNPSKNGIKLLLFDSSNTVDRADSPKRKVGFLLMINSAQENTSTLLGVFLDPRIRKLGLSKVILAIWLDLCLRSGLAPRTGIMNKPLLALVLQHTFGFAPSSATSSTTDRQRPGVLVEIGRGGGSSNGSTVEIYAPSVKSLQGVFGKWDLERERIQLLTTAPFPRGRACRVGTTLAVHLHTSNTSTIGDDDSNSEEYSLAAVVDRELAGRTWKGNLIYTSNDTPWRRVFLGSKA